MTGRRRVVLLALVAIVLSVAVRIPWLGGPYSRDEAFAMTAARDIRAGHLADFSFWSGRYLFYGAATALPLSPDRQLDLLGALAAAAGAAAMAWWASKLFSWPVAAYVAIAYAAVSSDLATQGQTANTELIINPLLIAAAALMGTSARREALWRVICAGLAVGVAGTVKEHVAVFALVMAVMLLRSEGARKDRWLRAAAFSAAAAVPWLITGLAFLAMGRFPMVYGAFLYTSGYPEIHLKDWIQGPLLLARNAAALYSTWPFWLLTAFAVGAKLLRRNVDGFVLGYLGAAVVMVIAPGYYFAHYYLLAIPAVMVGAGAFLQLTFEQGRKTALLIAVMAAIHLTIVQVAFMRGAIPLGVRALRVVNETTERQRDFSVEMGKVFRGARLMLYGADNQFFMYSGLRSAQPAFWLDYSDQTRFRRPTAGARVVLDLTLQQLRTSPPDVVLLQSPVLGSDPAPIAAELGRLVARDYVPVDASAIAPALGFHNGDLDLQGIYVRRDFVRRARLPL